MALTPEQLKVASKIVKIGRRRGESRKEIMAGLVTGITEANLTNPKYGHLDSVGWRQARSHYGSVKKRLKLGPSIRQFYKETSAVGGQKKMTPGQLAQTVQRSAYPERYDTHRKEAKQILRQVSGSSGMPLRRAQSVTQGRTGSRRVKVAPRQTFGQERRIAALDFIRQEDKTAADYAEFKDTIESLRNQPASFVRVPNQQQKKAIAGAGKTPTQVGSKQPKGIVAIGNMAQQMGLQVGEHPKFGGVGGGHTDGSFHDSGRAIDVSGDLRRLKRFAKLVAKRYGKSLAELFWNGPGAVNIDNGKRVGKGYVSGHDAHVHVAL